MDSNENNPFVVNTSSPQILDAEMGETPQAFEPLFFDQAYAEAPLYGENGYPTSPFQSPMPSKNQQVRSTVCDVPSDNRLSASSESSTQDSSSDSSGRHKRQSSSRSSHSLNPANGTRMAHGANRLNIRGGASGSFSSTRSAGFDFGAPRIHDTEFSNRTMEEAFDFDSAANTPSPLTSGSSLAASGPTARFLAIPQDSPMAPAAMLHTRTRSSTVSCMRDADRGFG